MELTKEQKERLKDCRYYHGEETNPFESDKEYWFKKGWFWDKERVYIKALGENDDVNFEEQFEGEYYNLFIGRSSYNGIAPYGLCVVMYTAFSKVHGPNCKEDFSALMDNYSTLGIPLT